MVGHHKGTRYGGIDVMIMVPERVEIGDGSSTEDSVV